MCFVFLIDSLDLCRLIYKDIEGSIGRDSIRGANLERERSNSHDDDDDILTSLEGKKHDLCSYVTQMMRKERESSLMSHWPTIHHRYNRFLSISIHICRVFL